MRHQSPHWLDWAFQQKHFKIFQATLSKFTWTSTERPRLFFWPPEWVNWPPAKIKYNWPLKGANSGGQFSRNEILIYVLLIEIYESFNKISKLCFLKLQFFLGGFAPQTPLHGKMHSFPLKCTSKVNFSFLYGYEYCLLGWNQKIYIHYEIALI